MVKEYNCTVCGSVKPQKDMAMRNICNACEAAYIEDYLRRHGAEDDS